MTYEEKLCVNCANVVKKEKDLWTDWQCNKDKKTNVVDGSVTFQPCYLMRAYYDKCGPQAALFEQKL